MRRPRCVWVDRYGPLTTFNGLQMRGTWTLMVVDLSTGGVANGTSVLNQWGLQITPAKPVSP